jgi:hypothetical protein
VESENRNFTLHIWGRIGEIKSFGKLEWMYIFARYKATIQIANNIQRDRFGVVG